MGKIVIHRHARHRAAQFEPPAHPLEAPQRRQRRVGRDPGMRRGSHRGQCVGRLWAPDIVSSQVPWRVAPSQTSKRVACAVSWMSRACQPVGRSKHLFAPGAAGQHSRQRLVAAVHHQPSRRAGRCEPDDGIGSRWQPDRGRCRRGRTRDCSGPRFAAGSERTSIACRRTPCRTRRPRSRSKALRPRRAENGKSCGKPPIRNPGSRPAQCRIQASIDVVVVLPWVPATASTQRPRSTCSASHCGPDT
jgi:hypothetical protein